MTRYDISVAINQTVFHERSLTWRKACAAVRDYGANVDGPIVATITPEMPRVLPPCDATTAASTSPPPHDPTEK